ncbi:MAG: SurA N-terminal domain-containing protein [Pseudomonadota bacterium]
MAVTANTTQSSLPTLGSAAKTFLLAISIGIGLLLGGLSQPSQAQTVFTAVLVNDVPITNFDINARAALLRLQGMSSSQAQSAAEEALINEALQRAEARRLGISVSGAELDQALQTIAGRSGLSVSQLGQALRSSGVDFATLRDSIEAQIIWDQVLRNRFQATVRVQEQDVLAALDDRGSSEDGNDGLTATEYTLREVIFVVPEGSGAADRRIREATTFRSRFESCAAGVAAARQLTDVVVQDETRRFSSDLSEELNQRLSDTPVGRLTSPEVGNDGVVMIAVCNKRDVRSDAEARRDVESELRSEEGVLLTRGYLRDLRASATIIRPNN